MLQPTEDEMPQKVGDARKRHPLPLYLRNPNIAREDGGAKGYRGKAFARMRERALKRDRFRSTISGLPQSQVRLTVDHIVPYRLGLTPHTNELSNLRTTDTTHNWALDMATTMREKKPKRRLRGF